MLPTMRVLARIMPAMRIPIWSYLDWKALIDGRAGAHDIERRLVENGYLHDPDFDRWYPLSQVTSLLSTPPPNPVAHLRIPTMFIVADEGQTPAYVKALYSDLPTAKKRLLEVAGSVYWCSRIHARRRMSCASGSIRRWGKAGTVNCERPTGNRLADKY